MATCLRRGGIFNNSFIANFQENATVKEFWKSDSIWLRWLTFLAHPVDAHTEPVSAGSSRGIKLSGAWLKYTFCWSLVLCGIVNDDSWVGLLNLHASTGVYFLRQCQFWSCFSDAAMRPSLHLLLLWGRNKGCRRTGDYPVLSLPWFLYVCPPFIAPSLIQLRSLKLRRKF